MAEGQLGVDLLQPLMAAVPPGPGWGTPAPDVRPPWLLRSRSPFPHPGARPPHRAGRGVRLLQHPRRAEAGRGWGGMAHRPTRATLERVANAPGASAARPWGAGSSARGRTVEPISRRRTPSRPSALAGRAIGGGTRLQPAQQPFPLQRFGEQQQQQMVAVERLAGFDLS